MTRIPTVTKKVDIRATIGQTKSRPVFDVWRYAYPEESPPPKVPWLRDAPSIFVGSWECLAFRRRSGLAWADETKVYADEFSDAALDRVAAMGCNHLILSHTKGFGRKAIHSDLESYREVIKRAHERGLRVGLYLRIDNAIPETLREEHPDVDEWLTIGEGGRPSHYSAQQTFRSRICYLHPSAIKYLESELHHAVVEMKADLIHLDGLHFSFYPSETCRCARCLHAYREWLKQRYPDLHEQAELFGPINFSKIELPSFDPLHQSEDPGFPPFQGIGDFIRSPDMQSWYRYRWDGEFALVRHIRRFIRQLNPNVAVTINPAWGACYNSYRIFTQWAERLLPWVDAVWSEDPLHLQFADGKLISKIGTYKLTREHGISTCCYHWMREPGRLEASLALSAAANGGHLACMGFTIRHLPHYTVGEAVKQNVAKWVQDHWSLFKDTRPAGEIALLRHQPSLAWNSRSPWWAANACEQLLVKMQIPWRMFDRLDPGMLKEVTTLLAPEACCLSDAEVAMLEQWANNGGRLLVTSGTASHNEHARRRPVNPFSRWIPNWQVFIDQYDAANIWYDWIENVDPFASLSPSIAAVGKGRIGFVPQIRSRCRKSTAYNYLTPEDFAPPDNAAKLASLLHELHGEHAITLRAPAEFVIERQARADHAEMIHLLQVADKVKPSEITLSGPLLQNRRVVVHALDDPPEAHQNQESITLAGVGRYTILELLPA